MQIFNPLTFRQFLGQPICQHHFWGTEERYVVSQDSLKKYEQVLKDTIYRHHSSFDLFNEIVEMGFPMTAQEMRQRNSGNPIDDRTQMGNLGEVIGTEFGTAILEFQTVETFPKRVNTNIDQSMKGVDIIGLRESSRPAELLIGEAKCNKEFDKNSIEDAYDHLITLRTKEASRILRFMKEIQKEEKQRLKNIDRHMAQNISRHYLILSITQSAPKAPFDVVAELFKKEPISPLTAVHIQFCGLKGNINKDRQEEENWLSKLFIV